MALAPPAPLQPLISALPLINDDSFRICVILAKVAVVDRCAPPDGLEDQFTASLGDTIDGGPVLEACKFLVRQATAQAVTSEQFAATLAQMKGFNETRIEILTSLLTLSSDADHGDGMTSAAADSSRALAAETKEGEHVGVGANTVTMTDKSHTFRARMSAKTQELKARASESTTRTMASLSAASTSIWDGISGVNDAEIPPEILEDEPITIDGWRARAVKFERYGISSAPVHFILADFGLYSLQFTQSLPLAIKRKCQAT